MVIKFIRRGGAGIGAGGGGGGVPDSSVPQQYIEEDILILRLQEVPHKCSPLPLYHYLMIKDIKESGQ